MNESTNIKQMINYIVDTKSQGSSFQALNIQMKLMLKGIPVKRILDDQYEQSEVRDLSAMIQKAATELNINLPQTITAI